MRVVRYPSARAFLNVAEAHLLAAEAANALILGVAYELTDAPVDPGKQPYFAVVHDVADLALLAFSNHPEKLGVTQAIEDAAIGPLVRDLVDACPGLRSIGGPEPTAGLVATELARLTGRACVPRMRMRIHQLTAIDSAPRHVTGDFRVATERDIPTLIRWVDGFQQETGEHGDPAAIVRERVRLGRLFVWDDSDPVSMAGWTGKTRNGARVNLVYTPVEHRGVGYASALVTALSRTLLERGNTFCTLYTDLANRTSNAIYARIGYYPVCDAGLYELAARHACAAIRA